MAVRWLFLFAFLTAIAGTALLRDQADIGKVAPTLDPQHANRPESVEKVQLSRTELLETLDRIVAYEQYYRSVYGHFTKLLARVGYPVPASISEQYDIRVSQSSSDRLLITATGEVSGQLTDFISIDQNYRIRSNFELPTPRREFLQAQALRHLRLLRDVPAGRSVVEQGVFRDFFKFEVREDSQNRRAALAVGVRAPVVGLQVEVSSRDSEELAEMTGSSSDESETGETTAQNSSLQPPSAIAPDEAFLAQKIFYGEIGRYAKSLGELSKIAKFGHDDSNVENRRTPSSVNLSTQDSELVIEPIGAEGAE